MLLFLGVALRLLGFCAFVLRRVLRLLDLFDLRHLTEIRIDPETGSKLTDLVRGLSLRANRSKRIAILATDEPALTGARAFRSALRKNPAYRIEIFDAPGPALAFLDQTDPDLIRALSRESVTEALR